MISWLRKIRCGRCYKCTSELTTIWRAMFMWQMFIVVVVVVTTALTMMIMIE
ncbi:uncharacterized protein DS421_20g695640 [Arachis hypogaea]|nr:uncharacterized protein DS421_20g695640 [Arachis hypogaea]